MPRLTTSRSPQEVRKHDAKPIQWISSGKRQRVCDVHTTKKENCNDDKNKDKDNLKFWLSTSTDICAPRSSRYPSHLNKKYCGAICRSGKDEGHQS